MTFHNPARVAGFLYLLLGVSVYRLVYIPNKLLVPGNTEATTRNIADHQFLFRLGIVSDLLAAILAIFLVLTLYQLFKGVDRGLAVLMVILGGPMPGAVYFFNVLNDVAALLLVRGSDFMATFDKPHANALAMLFLRMHDYGVFANEIFWGLWLFPFGLLVWRSGFLPRILGVFLFIACAAYLILSLTGILFPQYLTRVYSVVSPGMMGEGPILLWLLIKGPRPPGVPSTQ